MVKKQIVSWQKSYSVGIRLIDEQHMHLINLTNKLFNSCMSGREGARIGFMETIHEAVNYVGYHFSTEEKVMLRINYPDYIRHKQEHADFVRKVFIKVEDFRCGKIFAPISFVYFLRDWILHHIAVCDKRMGDYLLLLWRKGDLHKITLKVKNDKITNQMKIQ